MRAILAAMLFIVGCENTDLTNLASSSSSIQQLLSPSEVSKILRSLPKVDDYNLETIFADSQTLWYNESVMKDSYQDSCGASSNDKWPDLVAGSEDVIGGLHNRSKQRWQFPFGTTAGTDTSTTIYVEHFVSFTQANGQVKTTPITEIRRNDNRPQWTWAYQRGTIFGEVLFVKDGSNILPVEVRTRTKTSLGWTMDVFRPFPRASDLAIALQWLRPNSSDPKIVAMLRYLEDNTTLTPFSLKAKGNLASTFQQDGYLDYLPEFGDDDLVRELLATTPFVSAFNTSWKENGSQKTFAASTKSLKLSVVPNEYTAGLLKVTDEECMRCHKETGRLVSEFYDALYLYGEMWGKDGIFSFHPFDESLYSNLRQSGSDPGGFTDNRRLNPKLKNMGIFSKQ